MNEDVELMVRLKYYPLYITKEYIKGLPPNVLMAYTSYDKPVDIVVNTIHAHFSDNGNPDKIWSIIRPMLLEYHEHN